MNDSDLMRDVIQRVATGPHMSRDLPADDARRAMRFLLEGRADPVQAGVFLIALRMKRESDEELLGILDAIHEGVQRHRLTLPRLLTVVDPYDGFVRGTPVNAFLPALIAAAGEPVLTHGALTMGPKFGVTAAQVLAASGIDCAQTLTGCAAELEDSAIGWSYIDRSALAPELATLDDLRTRIVKRPCLTTLEVAVHALQATHTTLVTGYVHKAYPRVYSLIAEAAGFQCALIIRGVEGGVQPSLAQPSRYFTGSNATDNRRVDIDPTAIDIQRDIRDVPLPDKLLDESAVGGQRPEPGTAEYNDVLSRYAAHTGLAALEGEKGAARDALVYSAATILLGSGVTGTLRDAADAACQVLDSGEALRRFQALRVYRRG